MPSDVGAPLSPTPGLRARVLVAGPLHPEAVARLRGASCDVVLAPKGVNDPAVTTPATFVALVPLLTTRVDEALLARFPNLRLVANVSVGVDHVDLAACRARGVVVTNTPDVLTDATADLTMALLLAAARRVGEAERLLRSAGFPPWSPGFMLGKRLRGKTLGIIGLGRIGRAVADRARAFGLSVIATPRFSSKALVGDSPHLPHLPHLPHIPHDAQVPHVPRVALDALLRQSDFVSVHVPLTAATRHLLGARELSAMKPGAVLVNTSRGAVIDEHALVRALTEGPLFAAGLDVYEAEPKVHPGLLSLENVVLLPHIGSAEAETRRDMACLAADNVVAFLSSNVALTPV